MRYCYILLSTALCFLNVTTNAADREGVEFFEKKIRPLLVKRCFKCHGGAKAGGGLSLATSAGWQKGGETGPAIIPGEPKESLLIDAINYRGLEMPPPDKGGKLPKEEIVLLTKWVAMGAPAPGDDALGGMSLKEARSWWSFQALPKGGGKLTSAKIDALINEKLAQQKLTLSTITDKRTLIRRATYDLTGLPPTTAEVKAFLADPSADAFDKVIDRLLQSPQYGARWGRHWLDVVRYADTAGENSDRPLPHAWRYRNWVIEALNRDMPFDEFVRWQLAGDIVNAKTDDQRLREGIIATGYLAVARRYGHDIDKDIHLMHEDVIDNLGKNFLGLTLGCARCHDHKYDAVTSEDYYALYGIFNSTKFAFPGCEPKEQPRDLVPLMDNAKADAMMADYQRRLDEYNNASKFEESEAQRLKQVAAKAYRVLSKALVEETKSASIHENADGKLDRLAVKKGEVLQLTVMPNGNHGADTTRIELEITKLGDQPKTYNVSDLIPRLTKQGPFVKHNGATWCFFDVAEGPRFLLNRKDSVDGVASLQAWANGDTPSVFVNTSNSPVKVWTTLPPKAFFMHPGVKRDVALSWVCPEDGEYEVRGTVTDAHPAPGLDGVSFRFEHFPNAKFGDGLVGLTDSYTARDKMPVKPAIPVAYAVVEGNIKNARLQQRGDPKQPGDEIPRRWLSVFGGEAVSSGSGRVELAEWIVDHPLLARVMANRIWQWHFGRGIVATPNDFGSRGEAPTHPALLNLLAAQFRAGGYRIKPMHRLIMKTAAYQRSSQVDPSRRELDPNNRWLAHYSRRRLSAEEIRDSLLSASRMLDLSTAEAHPFPPEATWKFSQHAPFNAVYDTDRRSVFLMVQRQRRHPYLALFDGADPNSSTPSRESTTVPTQALYFLNDPFFHRQAAGFAATVDAKLSEDEQIQHAFKSLFARPATTDETTIATQFLAKYPGNTKAKWSAFARVLLSSNEFLYVD
ncbi:MAG: hypothetical protein CMJ78_11295 [Planctomycetaceae bacterium]|nr:hypothetical protein [Planctomycetaceae bacterium]